METITQKNILIRNFKKRYELEREVGGELGGRRKTYGEIAFM